VRYVGEGDPGMRLQCFCRECQYISGGASALLMGMPEEGFALTKGATKSFTRTDLENPVTRDFCPECGTHVVSRAPSLAGAVLIKVGTLDDPAAFQGPQLSLYTVDKQAFHHVTEGVPSFERLPG
jgi:hypothetical protein